MTAALDLGRAEILAYRRRGSGLEGRLPPGEGSLRGAAWAGLTDSMPRAALLSIHARVSATQPSAWEDPSLVQVWGPRFSAYVVAAQDVAVFTLSRLPDDAEGCRRATDAADRLERFLDGRRMNYGEAGHALGHNPNWLRYGTTTGRLLIRWEGAGRPVVWTVPAPDVDPFEARLELARRYLHVFGPATAGSFAEWAGIKSPRAAQAFEALGGSLTRVRKPIGDAWILATDEQAFRAGAASPAASSAPSSAASSTASSAPSAFARLLPSGDTYFLLWGADREILVPDAACRAALWTSRVWPGAVLLGGEVVGTWRRADEVVTIDTWRTLSPAERDAVAAEAESLPLPGLRRPISVRWGG